MTEAPSDVGGEKVCFVICPIGEIGSDTRERSDQVGQYVIQPAIERCGYARLIRADHLDRPGLITHQVIDLLLNAPLVIADLTDRNANVFYELAIRHAVRKPLVQIIDASDRIPFDVADTRTIKFDWRDLRSAHDCTESIVRAIQAVEADPSAVDNPLTAAIAVAALQQSGDATERALATVLEWLQGLDVRMISVEDSILNMRLQAGMPMLMPDLPTRRPADPTRFKAGDRVRHPTFGTGIVVGVRSDALSEIIDVNFAGGVGVKKLDTAFAPISAYGDPANG
jgi:hypothetical protein